MKTPDPLESIFFAALEKASPEERAAFLKQACGDDIGLREQLDRMLLAQEGSFLNAPPEGLASASPAPSPAELAERFPQLEFLELLGQGGMGAVYKARQPSLDRLVAVKILTPAAERDPSFAERFSREARAMARLSHPHIVNVYDFGQNDGQFFLIMEYVDGVNLRQAIRTGTVAPAAAMQLVGQICDALQYAHDEGVVHRDIKPENILVDRRGRVKIADFGLAKLMNADVGTTELTGAEQVMGTFRYMAPEQMERSRDVDHRADIYSLGVVFYELLTGDVPMGRFRPPSTKVQVDVRVDEIVLKSLEREPERRYQHASDVKHDVQSVSSSQSAASAATRRHSSAISQMMAAAMGLVIGLLSCAAGMGSWILCARAEPSSFAWWSFAAGGCSLVVAGVAISRGQWITLLRLRRGEILPTTINVAGEVDAIRKTSISGAAIVIGALLSLVGIALVPAAFSLAAPHSYHYWGWVLGACGCFFGGFWMFIAGCNAYRMLHGQTDWFRSPGRTALDRCLIGYGVLGIVVAVAGPVIAAMELVGAADSTAAKAASQTGLLFGMTIGLQALLALLTRVPYWLASSEPVPTQDEPTPVRAHGNRSPLDHNGF